MIENDVFDSRIRRSTAPDVVAAVRADERKRMARDLHDTLAQGLAAITMQLQVVECRFGSAIPPQAMQHLAAIRELSRENLCEARRYLGRLRSASPETLEQALARTIDCHHRIGEHRIVLDVGEAAVAPPEVTTELTRIAQEGINNALRHACASRIVVSLRRHGATGISVTVADDGRGIDRASHRDGFGIDGMRERAAMIGATLRLISHAGRGTRLTVTWRGPESAIQG